MEPQALQVELERLGRRGFVVLPFIEPGVGGGAELAQKGLAWLIAYEGGKPKDVPVALAARQGPRASEGRGGAAASSRGLRPRPLGRANRARRLRPSR